MELGAALLENWMVFGVCSSFDLQQLITEATRVTETTETLLDHMYTNNIDKVNSSGHSVIHTGLSGHS